MNERICLTFIINSMNWVWKIFKSLNLKQKLNHSFSLRNTRCTWARIMKQYTCMSAFSHFFSPLSGFFFFDCTSTKAITPCFSHDYKWNWPKIVNCMKQVWENRQPRRCWKANFLSMVFNFCLKRWPLISTLTGHVIRNTILILGRATLSITFPIQVVDAEFWLSAYTYQV